MVTLEGLWSSISMSLRNVIAISYLLVSAHSYRAAIVWGVEAISLLMCS